MRLDCHAIVERNWWAVGLLRAPLLLFVTVISFTLTILGYSSASASRRYHFPLPSKYLRQIHCLCQLGTSLIFDLFFLLLFYRIL